MKKYYKKASFTSKFLFYLVKLSNLKKHSDTVEGAKQYIKELSTNQNEYNLPKKLNMKKQSLDGMEIYYYNGKLTDNKKKLLYIHGGSYVEEANYFQIKFAMKIAKKTNSTLVFPRYPLAPKGNYKTMYQLIEKLYNNLIKTNNEINFLGDSAGGGFILSFSMYLRDRKLKLPNNIIMMSPWLDISMSNPNLYIDAKTDYMCGVDGSRYFGKLWADGLDLKSFLVSPIYGELDNLSNITIIVGERGICKSDCLKLIEKLDEKNIESNFIMYKQQGHDFGVYPTKEGKLAIKDICNIINNEKR